MATSNSIDFNQTRNELIEDALQLIGVYDVGRTVSAEDMQFAANMLNKMVKAWQGKGIHLWAKEEAVLILEDNVAKYTLSSDSGAARASLASDSILTTLSAQGAAAATSLSVMDTTGMAVSDNIGIILDDDTVHWTTIATIPDSTSLTIASGLASVAASGSNVYTFTTRINKPLKVHSVRRLHGIDSGSTSTKTELPMTQLSHSEYFDLPNKTANGTPSHYYYNPDISDGSLYLWPRPDNPEYYLQLTFSRMIEDFDASTDNPDFPTEWLEVLTYQLAYRLAPAFGKDKNIVQPEASLMLQDMLSWDNEVGSVTLMPEITR